jgi:hypothetical protein
MLITSKGLCLRILETVSFYGNISAMYNVEKLNCNALESVWQNTVCGTFVGIIGAVGWIRTRDISSDLC